MKKIILIVFMILIVGCGVAPPESVREVQEKFNLGVQIENSRVRRFVDYEAQVVCYTVGAWRSIDCMPLSQTALPKE